MPKKIRSHTCPPDEEENLLRSLREHKRVVEADDADAPLPPGATHILVKNKKPGGKSTLVEKRKSFF